MLSLIIMSVEMVSDWNLQKKSTWQFKIFFPFLMLGLHFLQIPEDV